MKELDSELDSKYSRYEDDWVCSGDGWSPSYKEEQRPVDLNAPLETGFVSCSQPTVRISQVVPFVCFLNEMSDIKVNLCAYQWLACI